MSVIINPGTGPVGDESTLENAEANINALITEMALEQDKGRFEP